MHKAIKCDKSKYARMRIKYLIFLILSFNISFGQTSKYVLKNIIKNNDTIQLEKLVAKGLDLNGKYFNRGTTLLQKALYHEKYNLAKYLVQKNIDFNQKNKDGFNSIKLAASNAYYDLLKIMVLKGGKINTEKCFCTSVIATVIRNGIFTKQLNWPSSQKDISKEVEILKFLLPLDSNFVCPDYNCRGLTPLIYSMRYADTSMAKLILNKYGNINAKDKKGNTALHLVVRRNNYRPDLVAFLLRNKIDRTIRNNKGETALEIAERIGMDDVIKLFKQY